MKRKEIIATIETAGKLMDHIGFTIANNDETGEVVDSIIVTEEEIRAMQTTLHLCNLLIKSEEPCDPLEFVGKLIGLHATMKLEGIVGNDKADESGEKPAEGDAE